MILSMMTALVAIALLPVVFLAALSQSAEAHPRPMREVLSSLVQPLADAVEHAVTYARRNF